MASIRFLGAGVCLGIFVGAASTPWWRGAVETKRMTKVRAKRKNEEEEVRGLLGTAVAVAVAVVGRETTLAGDSVLMTEEKGVMMALMNG